MARSYCAIMLVSFPIMSLCLGVIGMVRTNQTIDRAAVVMGIVELLMIWIGSQVS